MTRFSRGDVVLVLFPDSSLRSAKRRPALVIQADNIKTGLPQTIVAIMTHNLATIFNNEIDRTIGSWPQMSAVDAALRHTLGL